VHHTTLRSQQRDSAFWAERFKLDASSAPAAISGRISCAARISMRRRRRSRGSPRPRPTESRCLRPGRGPGYRRRSETLHRRKVPPRSLGSSPHPILPMRHHRQNRRRRTEPVARSCCKNRRYPHPIHPVSSRPRLPPASSWKACSGRCSGSSNPDAIVADRISPM